MVVGYSKMCGVGDGDDDEDDAYLVTYKTRAAQIRANDER